MNLFEGLKANDLDGLIDNIISVDEFNSKISDDSIVVGIKVRDKFPAEDLSRFLEYSEIDTLDCEVSPGPSDDGFYYVFIEFIRDEEFIDKLLNTLELVTKLCEIKIWRMNVYHKKLSYRVTRENIESLVRLETTKVTKEHVEKIGNYLFESYCEKISLNESVLSLDNISYQIIDFDKENTIYNRYKLQSKPVNINESYFKDMNILQQKLGYNWSINNIDDYLLVRKITESNLLLLKKY